MPPLPPLLPPAPPLGRPPAPPVAAPPTAPEPPAPPLLPPPEAVPPLPPGAPPLPLSSTPSPVAHATAKATITELVIFVIDDKGETIPRSLFGVGCDSTYAPCVDDPRFVPPPPTVEPPAPAAPSSGLKILGIAQCALGVFGLLSAPLTLVTRALAQDPGSRRVQHLLWDGWLGAWTYLSLAIGTALAVLLIVAGVGVIKGRALGRKLSLVHAATAIALVIIGQIIAATALYPALFELASSGSAAERGGAIGGVVGGLFGSLIGLILPAVELYVMTRPHVKEQLAR